MIPHFRRISSLRFLIFTQLRRTFRNALRIFARHRFRFGIAILNDSNSLQETKFLQTFCGKTKRIDYPTKIPKQDSTKPPTMTADEGDASTTRVTRSTVIFALCAALNSCNLGYDIGVSTNAGPLVQSEFGLTDVQRELFLGSLNFWSIFGSMFSHWICDVLGRRRAFQVAAMHFVIGVLILAFANGFATLMAGR